MAQETSDFADLVLNSLSGLHAQVKSTLEEAFLDFPTPISIDIYSNLYSV
jgi:hypothetical protein